MLKHLIINFLFVSLITLTHISSQIIKNDDIGQISIFDEPTNLELMQWENFDLFMIETYRYIKNEKKLLLENKNNPFEDSLFIKKFKHITYLTIYESAKAYRDSVYFKSNAYKKYKNINQWAWERFPEFMNFNKEFNNFIKEK